jgi:transcriptional regulator with XRE-family HTH domain
MDNPFGSAVKQAREAAKLTQGEVCEKLGFRPSFYSDVEHGKKALSREHWLKLVKALPSLSVAQLATLSVEAGYVKVNGPKLRKGERELMAKLLTKLAESGR